MTTMLLRRFVRDESGATAIEYGMLVALFCVFVLFGARAIGSGISNTFTTATDTMKNAN